MSIESAPHETTMLKNCPIENHINNDPYRTRKRPAGTPGETHPAKQRRSHQEMKPDDLPVFKFSLNLMYDVSPQNGIALPDWLAVVDEQKKKLGWSDNMTIQKVLLKLQTLPELHSWFGSMADIMTWDEWKIRLLKAFPPAEDFSVLLKRAVNRKKRANETFVNYLQQKTEFLEKVNITGKNAVSCVIASLTYSDLRISCIARMGNYQLPIELTEYFMKCDEKESLAVKQAPDASTPQTPEKNKEVKKPPEGAHAQTNNKSGAAAKKKQKKCFKCLSIGHNSSNCPRTPSSLAQKPRFPLNKLEHKQPAQMPGQAKPNATSPKKKKKKSPLCKFCGKYGHLISVCSRYKQKQLDSPVGSAQVHAAGRCSHCGDATHASFNCPRSQKAAPSPLFDRRSAQCGFCQRKGHTTDSCHIANRKANRNAKQGQAAASREQHEPACSHCGSTKHPSRHCGRAQQPTDGPETGDRRESCRFCGSQSHLSSACYYSSKPEGERWREDQSSAQNSRDRGYTSMLCTKCYKLGHKPEDCSRFNMYRQ